MHLGVRTIAPDENCPLPCQGQGLVQDQRQKKGRGNFPWGQLFYNHAFISYYLLSSNRFLHSCKVASLILLDFQIFENSWCTTANHEKNLACTKKSWCALRENGLKIKFWKLAMKCKQFFSLLVLFLKIFIFEVATFFLI